MALAPVQLKEKRKGGKGGLFGTIAGVVGGGLLGAFGGPAGAAAGASLGGKIGGTVGGLVDPGRIEGGRGVPLAQEASRNSEVQLAQLLDAQKELMNTTKFTEPEKQEALASLNPAVEVLRRKLGA